MNGSDFVPKDWADYIGDRIESIAVDLSYPYRPKSCTELTQKVHELVPSVLKAYGVFTEYTDGETEREPIPIWFRVAGADTHMVQGGQCSENRNTGRGAPAGF